MVKQMLNWDSPLSIGFDFLFGLIPAMYWGLMSFFGIILSLVSIPDLLFGRLSSSWGVKEYFESFFGFYACISMFYITIQRSRAVKKRIFILGLSTGIIVCFVSFFAPPTTIQYDLTNSAALFLLLITFLPAIVAIKHIIMLTRA
jgi:hypothetical protein